MSEITNPKIFIVEDNPTYLNLLNLSLHENNYDDTEMYSSGEECLSNLHKDPDIVILDYQLGGMNGLDVLNTIKKVNPKIQVIFLSAQETLEVAIKSLKLKAYDYIIKDEHAFDKLFELIAKITRQGNLREEEDKLKKLKTIFFISLLVLAVLTIIINKLLY